MSEIKFSDSKARIQSFSLSSKSVKSISVQLKSATSAKRSRTSLVRDEDSDSEKDDHLKNSIEAVSGFDHDGAIREVGRSHVGPLVIERLENKDWKSEVRARKKSKNLLPPEIIAAQKKANQLDKHNLEAKQDVEMVDIDNMEKQWGLILGKKQIVDPSPPSGDNKMIENHSQNILEDDEKDERQELQSLDQEALQALLKGDKETKTSELVISASTWSTTAKISEDDAYKRAIAAAPDSSTLEDYERVPVEEFGAALLRGMGWNGEKVGGLKDIKPRQNLLGLGAKELREAEELGAWVNKSDTKKLRPIGSNKNDKTDRKLKISDFKRQEERRIERREERSGGTYRKSKETDRNENGEHFKHRHRNGRR